MCIPVFYNPVEPTKCTSVHGMPQKHFSHANQAPNQKRQRKTWQLEFAEDYDVILIQKRNLFDLILIQTDFKQYWYYLGQLREHFANCYYLNQLRAVITGRH